MLMGIIHQEYITILNVYVPKNQASKHINQKNDRKYKNTQLKLETSTVLPNNQ